ncbi:hypothetical protein C7M84_015085 [Penaeus vannamei]|uniref:Myb/SANT-like DNA-binding domain-containing protein n=1 Tax=Penaeus vannamei TaxID=6689 RepID=A0A3R7LYQ8_PENVA|nr:hypothetical protein C7M84_015085 [Penaeus vannamei]
MEQDFPWTEEQTFCFIQARARLKTSSNGTPDYLYQSVIDELGLTGQISPLQARRHWDALVTRYKELSQPALEPEDAAPPSWPFYAAMQDALLTMPPSVLPMPDGQEMEEPNVEGTGNGLDGAFHQGHESQGDDNSQEMDSLEVDEVWTEPRIFRFIELRGAKEADMVALGPSPVFAEILEELGMSEEITPAQARKKWTQLVRRYLEFKGPYGESGRPMFTSNPSMITPDLNDGGWLFYSSMHAVMEAIKATSPDGGTKTRKSPEYTWSVDVTRKFIKIRGEKHAEISQKGHNAVYQEILEKLGIGDKVSVMMARKKWNYLVKRYQDEEMAGGERSWAFMKEMGQVMKHFRGANVNKLKSRASPEFLWPNELTRRFIELRVSRHSDFLETGIQNTYTEIMEELGLEHILNPNQLRKKWNYLVAKYKELSCTTGPDGTSPAPHSWPFYDDMHQALQQIPESALHSNRTVRTNFENIWTKEVTTRFIQLRGARPPDNTKKVSSVFANIVDELGLTGVITPNQARKKWNYLWSKYVDLSHPDVSEYTRQSWPFYTTMQAVVGALPLSQVLTKKGLVDELEEDEDPQKKIVKRTRQYTCFVCGKTVPQHQQHPHMRPVVDEAAEAARNLGAYQEITTTEDDNSLVVTEITEAPAQVEQTVLVDPLSVPQGMMHHPQVAHMQPPMTMHHPMHQQMHHHTAMSRLGVLYHMNMHHPGPSHLNM